MAKDDYYVIVTKILVFLYKRLKTRDTRAVEEYILPMTDDFPIDEEYLRYVVEKLYERGYVERVMITRTWGGNIIRVDTSHMQITPEGIDYLRENSTIRKVAETLREAIPIASLFLPS